MGHPVPVGSSLPGFHAWKLEGLGNCLSLFCCLLKWEVVEPGPLLLVPDKEAQLREAF